MYVMYVCMGGTYYAEEAAGCVCDEGGHLLAEDGPQTGLRGYVVVRAGDLIDYITTLHTYSTYMHTYIFSW